MAQQSFPEIGSLLASGKYSDLRLVCQGQEFKVHRAIVCTQSKVLAAACDGSFQEASSGTIHIDEFDAETVERLVEYLYTKDYDHVVEDVEL